MKKYVVGVDKIQFPANQQHYDILIGVPRGGTLSIWFEEYSDTGLIHGGTHNAAGRKDLPKERREALVKTLRIRRKLFASRARRLQVERARAAAPLSPAPPPIAPPGRTSPAGRVGFTDVSGYFSAPSGPKDNTK